MIDRLIESREKRLTAYDALQRSTLRAFFSATLLITVQKSSCQALSQLMFKIASPFKRSSSMIELR